MKTFANYKSDEDRCEFWFWAIFDMNQEVLRDFTLGGIRRMVLMEEACFYKRAARRLSHQMT